MNSFNTIIHELTTQKQLLDEHGFVVDIKNKYPSPAEITNAIKKINFDFTDADAKESEVVAGKTFYAQNNELKTGTMDINEVNNLRQYVNAFVSGKGCIEIIIPDDVTQIRPYAYNSYFSMQDDEVYSKENLTIPEHITKLGEYSFQSANITGTLIVPPTAGTMPMHCFSYTNISEAIIGTSFNNQSAHALGYCKKLKKITITEPVTAIYKYTFSYLRVVEELILPTTLTTIADSCFVSSSIKMIRFLCTTPPPITGSVFNSIKSTILIAPYSVYYDYYTATNYQLYTNPILGFGTFAEGESLPSTLSDMAVTWHTSMEDAIAYTNPITTSPGEVELYAIFTPVETTE